MLPNERVATAMRAAATGANLWIVGRGDLAGQFAGAGLLDESGAPCRPIHLLLAFPCSRRRAEPADPL